MTETDLPRRFHLQRDIDVTGTSGTGRVANGVLWPDGTATVRWRSSRPSVVHWDRINDAEFIHGHGGATRIMWDDPEPAGSSPADRLARIAQAHSKNQGPGGITSGDCDECGQPWPCPTYTWATTDRDPTATWDPADDAPEEPCPAGLLPTGNEPVERCIVEGPHEGHVTATGKRWAATGEGEPR